MSLDKTLQCLFTLIYVAAGIRPDKKTPGWENPITRNLWTFSLFTMKSSVLCSRDHGEIGRVVVTLVTVDMVDLVSRMDGASHFLRSNCAVGELPAGAGVVLTVSVVRSESCHWIILLIVLFAHKYEGRHPRPDNFFDLPLKKPSSHKPLPPINHNYQRKSAAK